MVLGCENDETTPVSEARSIYEQAREPKRWHMLAGKGHFDIYVGAGLDEALSVELPFLIEHL